MRILIFRKKYLVIGLIIFIFIFFGISLTFSLPQLSYRFSKIHKTVVIDPGHGSIDSGAVYGNLYEKHINLQVALILKELLEKANIQVVMTRSDDSLYNNDRNDDIINRVRITQKVKADAFISIHCNKFPSSEPFGGQAYYYAGEDSKLLAELIQEELKLIQPENYRSIGRGNYYVLKKAPCPATIVEIGFISNPIDRKRITDPKEQKRIAMSIRNGLLNFFYHQFEKGDDLIEEIYTPDSEQKTNPLKDGLYLYFPEVNSTNQKLVQVHSSILQNDVLSVSKNYGLSLLESVAIKALEKLMAGPQSKNLIPVFPEGTKLKSIKISNGLATVNFNQALIDNHWGGLESERATVSALVKTLTSIEGIDKVMILIDGKYGQSIAGHIYFDTPLTADMF